MIGAAGLLAAALLGPAAEDPGERRLLDALRERGLEQLSGALVRKRLEDPGLTAAARAEMAFDLAAAAGELGNRQLDAAARRAAWRQADQLLQPFLANGPEDEVARYEFRLRWGVLIRERGRVARELGKALPADAELAADAAANAETAARALGQLAKTLKQRLEQIVGGKNERFVRLGALSLRADLEAGTAWALFVAARTDPAERATAAIELDNLLGPYAREYSPDPGTLEAFLQLADAYRVLGRFAEARKKLAVFDDHPEAPADRKLRAGLLMARTDLDAGDVAAALRRLDLPADKHPKPSAEWRCLLFEALLRSPAGAGGRDRQEEAMALLDLVERTESKYWQLRCENVLKEHGSPAAIGANPTALRRLARLRRDAKDWSEAFAQYDRASARAEAAGQPELAGRIALEAAEAAEAQGNPAEAGRRRLAAAAWLAGTPLQTDAWLRGAEALLRGAGKDPAARTAAAKALDAALADKNLPDARRHEAAWIRGNLAERSNDTAAALRSYAAIPPGHPRYAAASDAWATLSFNAWCADGGTPAPAHLLPAALAECVERAERLAGDAAPTAARARAVLQWLRCRLLARGDPGRIAEALRLAASEVLPNPALPASLRTGVDRQCLDWQLTLGDAAAARAAAAAWATRDAAGAVAFLLTRSPLEPDLAAPVRAARAAAAAAGADAPAGTELRLERRLLRAEAAAAGNRGAEARRLLKELRDEAPRDLRVAAALARVKEQAGDLAGAQADWDLMSRGLRRGTAAWLDAVAENARLLLRLNRKAEAKKLVDFAVQGYGTAGRPETRARLAALAQELAAP